jgi:hypothetical protein
MKKWIIELTYALVFALSGLGIFGVAYFSYVNDSISKSGQTVLILAVIGLFATLYFGSKNSYIPKKV